MHERPAREVDGLCVRVVRYDYARLIAVIYTYHPNCEQSWFSIHFFSFLRCAAGNCARALLRMHISIKSPFYPFLGTHTHAHPQSNGNWLLPGFFQIDEFPFPFGARSCLKDSITLQSIKFQLFSFARCSSSDCSLSANKCHRTILESQRWDHWNELMHRIHMRKFCSAVKRKSLLPLLSCLWGRQVFEQRHPHTFWLTIEFENRVMWCERTFV